MSPLRPLFRSVVGATLALSVTWALAPVPGASAAPGPLLVPGASDLRVYGDAGRDEAGYSTAVVGDVNNDGIDDLAVAVPVMDSAAGVVDTGSVFIVHGTGSARAAVDLRTLGLVPSAAGFRVDGPSYNYRFGLSVAGAGDVNGDGVDDLVVGSRWASDGGRTDSGAAHVIYGTDGNRTRPVDVRSWATTASADGFLLVGSSSSQLGHVVGRAGDFNGDGVGDLVLGARGAAQAYVVFGQDSTRGLLDLAAWGAGWAGVGLRVDGPAGSWLGSSAAGVGDVNGDGVDDVVVGQSRGAARGRVLAGSAYVLLGSGTGRADSLDVSGWDGTGSFAGFRVDGRANDQLGTSAAGAGDLDGDGLDDLVLGAPGASRDGLAKAGSSVVVYGSGTRGALVDAAPGSWGDGFRIDGRPVPSELGWAVSTAGDVNHDGLADVIIGAPSTDRTTDPGGAYVVHGSRTRPGAAMDVSAWGATSTPLGFRIDGARGGDRTGFSVAGGGDLDGDGVDDVVVGAPRAFNNRSLESGVVHVVRGDAAPEAVGDAYTTAEDTPLVVPAANGVLSNDVDRDGDTLSAALVSGPSRGSLSLAPDGSFGYTPSGNFHGSDSFTYRAVGDGRASATATVTLTVASVNDAPVAVADAYETNEDTALTVSASGVLANDVDVDGDALSAVLVSGTAHGTLTLNANGTFVYTPLAGFAGRDSFTYRVSDGTLLSGPVTVTLTVTSTNRAPVAENDAYTVAEDTTLTVDGPGLLANDTDADGDTLTASLVTGPARGGVTLDADGGFVYRPDANVHGVDTFTYRASDGDAWSEGTVTLTVRPVNDAPVARTDAFTTDEDVTLTVAAPGVLANDSDEEGHTLTATLLSAPAHGSLTLRADGSFEYEPDADFHGADYFTYWAFDGTATSTPTRVTITVAPVNDAPVGRSDAYRTDENVLLTVHDPDGVLANDTDVDSDRLTATLVDDVAHGSLTLAANGTFRYVPDRGFDGMDTFTYAVSDGAASTGPVTVTLTVDPELTFADPNVKLHGTVGVGSTVSATATSTPAADSVAYEWRVDGTRVGTGEAYTVTAADAGKQLVVAATLTKHGHETATATSVPATVAHATFASTAVAISGTVKAGETLTATTTASPAADPVALVWFVDGARVGTGSSYGLTDADEGKTVRVEATFTKPGHVTATASAETARVASRLAPAIDFDGPGKARLGQGVELSWSTTRADSVRASGGWSGVLPSSGTRTVKPARTGVTTYVVTATNSNGTVTARRAVLVTHPARTLTVTAGTQRTKATKKAPASRRVVVRVKRLAPGEPFTVQVVGRRVTGTASAKGEAKVVVPAPKVRKLRTYPVRVTGSVADRAGTAQVRVVPAALKVSLRYAAVRASDNQKVAVTGANPREKVKVRYRGAVVASGRADRTGTFRFVLAPGQRWGTFTVRATAVGTQRSGTARLTVVQRCRVGVPRCA